MAGTLTGLCDFGRRETAEAMLLSFERATQLLARQAVPLQPAFIRFARALRQNGELLFIKFDHEATADAGAPVWLFEPIDWYVEWVAAVARDTGARVIVSHGWPILSVGGAIPTVTEDGGGSNVPVAEAS